MNNLNRLVILGVLIGLLYVLYVYQEQLVASEETKQVENKKIKKINDDESQNSDSRSSYGSLTLKSSDLTLGTTGSNELNSTYDSEISEDEKQPDGMNFQVAE